jgi:hypothetical protein
MTNSCRGSVHIEPVPIERSGAHGTKSCRGSDDF